tara:strand:- start:151 stop:627 length:477 start_codon:yes stop_codon:yes gene_type:complete
MFKPEGSRKTISTEDTGEGHTLTIQTSGQLVFNVDYHHSGLLKNDQANFFEIYFMDDEERMIIAFATGAELEEEIADFDPEATDLELASDGIYRLKHSNSEGAELTKIAIGAIRSCRSDLVPEDGFSLKWIEGEDLEVDFHNKLISLNCKDKKQLPPK